MAKTKKKNRTYRPLVHPSITMESPLNVAIVTNGKLEIMITCDWFRQNQTTNHPAVIYSYDAKEPVLLSSKELEYLESNFMLQRESNDYFNLEEIMRGAISHLMAKFFFPKKRKGDYEARVRWNEKIFVVAAHYEEVGKTAAVKKRIFAEYINTALKKAGRKPVENLMVKVTCSTDPSPYFRANMAAWSRVLRDMIDGKD